MRVIGRSWRSLQSVSCPSRMNEDYAAVYQEFLGNPKTEARGRAIASRLFTCRLFCDDKKVRSVIVRHNQMEREEIYPCSHGVAYPRIYTDDAVVLFRMSSSAAMR